MKLALIWAMSENRVIGRDGDLPWRLPADLRHFKKATSGCTIIMGRKTWESLPGALPKRRNLVVTRQEGYLAEGAEVFPSFEAALEAAAEQARDDDRVFVVGGAGIYEAAIPLADELWVTFVHATVEGDTEFPELDLTGWRLVEQDSHPGDDENEFACTFARLEPKGKGKKKGGGKRRGKKR